MLIACSNKDSLSLKKFEVKGITLEIIATGHKLYFNLL
jgi:hypothetical protein